MNIDRHNYEEFFILYLDNELSSEQRSQVELFVQANPDLKEELAMLQQTQFMPDATVTFENKESLVRYADCDITSGNYEEWLLLYIDNELTPKEKVIVENFVIAHPAVKNELELLKKTKLQREDAIVFPNKESLYRKEETTRRVIALRWWRIAAAAVLLLGIATTSLFVFNTATPVVADTPASKGTTDNKSEKAPLLKGNQQQDQALTTTKEKKTVTNEPKNDVAIQSKASTVDDLNGDKYPDAVTGAEKKNNNRILKNTHKVSQNKINEQPAIATTNEKTNNLSIPVSNPNMNGKIENPASLVRNTASNEVLTNPQENDGFLAVTYNKLPTFNLTEDNDEIDQPEEKKNKLRGFFRKIVRTVEKNTNIKATNEDDRLLIGGLAFKL